MTAELTTSVETLQRQRDEAVRRAESLRRVIELISSELALEPLLTRIIESAVDLIDAQYGTIGLVTETADGPVVKVAAVVNMPPLELEAEFPPGVGLAGLVLREQRPIWLQRYGDLEQPSIHEFVEHTVIGIPIWWGQRMIGYFGIGAEPPHRFTRQDAETLELVARHAAIAIENARRYQQERRRNERLALIARIGRIVTTDLLLDDLLQNAAEAIHELLGYAYVAIPLIDPMDPTTLVIGAVGGRYAEGQPRHRLPMTRGIIGAAIQSRCVELVNDVRSDPRYIPIPGAENLRAELAVPILRGEHVLGVLNIESEEPFTEEDAAGIQIIADQLAVAIEHARLFETEQRRAARISAINRIGRLITSSLSLDEIIQTAVEAINEHLRYHNVALLLVDPDDAETLVLRAYSGVYTNVISGEYRQSVNDGIIGVAAQTRQVVLVTDVYNDPRYIPIPGTPPIYAELAVPIVVGERLFGVLNVESVQPIVKEDAAGFEIIADQLGIAIEHARLFEAEQRRANRIAHINRIGRLLTSSFSYDVLFQTAVEAIRDTFKFDYLSAGIIDPNDPETIILLAQAGPDSKKAPPGYRQSIYDGLAGVAARTRQRILVNDVSKDPRYISVLGPSIYANLVVPIIFNNRLLGVIVVESERRIDRDDAEGIEIVADQLGAALENARLFDDMQQVLKTTQFLYETSQRISTAMSVDEVILAYLEQVASRGRYACSVVLLEMDQRGQRTAMIVRGRWSPNEGTRLDEIRWPFIHAPFTPLLDAGQVVTFANVHTDPSVPAVLRDMQARDQRPALALIPLMVRGQRIGMVMLGYPNNYEWPEADLRSYQATAAQLATAIDSRQQHLLLSERSQQIAVLEERRRLARELHDSVTQSLFSMSLLAQVVPDLWEIDREEALQSLEQIRDLTRGALTEMRALLFELRPTDQDEQSFIAALRQHVASFERRTNISVTVEVTDEPVLPNEIAQAFLRIAQEALTNVSRHARAHRVHVSIRGSRPVRMSIADNGRGFQIDRVAKGRLGLISMRERAAKINARFQICSAVGQGTEIIVEWPNTDDERL